MVQIPFRNCVLNVHSPVYMETVFPDGGVVPALFTFDDAAKACARDAGYNDDDAGVALMHWEHDIAHSWLAEQNGLPYSPVLYRVAGGPDVPADKREHEEGAVLAFQRAINMLTAAWGWTAFRDRFDRNKVLRELGA